MVSTRYKEWTEFYSLRVIDYEVIQIMSVMLFEVNSVVHFVSLVTDFDKNIVIDKVMQQF